MYTCSVFGVDCLNNVDEEKLKKIFRQLIAFGVDNFLFGTFSKFDDLAKKICSRICYEYSNIKITEVRLNSSPTKEDGRYDKTIYERLIRITTFADDNQSPEEQLIINYEKMIDQSQVILTCTNMQDIISPARRAVQYASIGLASIINLFNATTEMTEFELFMFYRHVAVDKKLLAEEMQLSNAQMEDLRARVRKLAKKTKKTPTKKNSSLNTIKKLFLIQIRIESFCIMKSPYCIKFPKMMQ